MAVADTRQHSIAARLSALLLFSAMAVWAGVSVQRPPAALLAWFGRWDLTADQIAYAALPILFLLLLTACFALVHWVDRRFGGDGLTDRVLRASDNALQVRGYRYDLQVVQGLLSKQSIFTALAVALLVAAAGALLSDAFRGADGARLLLGAIILALFLTLLLALTSITCYTHALQFQWQERYGKALVRLGSKFEIGSFYLLSAALLLGLALWQAWATYVFALSFALMLYRYYFFRVIG